MIEFRWRLAKGGFVSKPVDQPFAGHGGMKSAFVSEEANSIQAADGRHLILQMRQVRNWLEVTNELQSPIWGEWEDVSVEGRLSHKHEPRG